MVIALSIPVVSSDNETLTGGWKKVRWTTSTTNWHRATDFLSGTDIYCNNAQCSVNFEDAVQGWD